MKKKIFEFAGLALLLGMFFSCGNKTKTYDPEKDTIALEECPTFSGDSAYNNVVSQCDFGPRVTGTKESQECGDWIIEKFKEYGCTVKEQKQEVTLYDGTKVMARNIIASTNPNITDRVLICSHWDSRPWADNDPDESKHHTPVLAANDGASGIAVMLEMARQLQKNTILSYGVDFVCFDAEDMGTPDWADPVEDNEKTWCLGSKVWADNASQTGYQARYGVLLDMVGGRGSQFYYEQVSRRYAEPIVQMIWHLGDQIGYKDYFINEDGGALIDDHVNVNTIAGINCLDIVPYYKDGPSSFGPTWHTVSDTPENIDPKVLEAVGQTLLQLLYNDAK